MNMAKKSATELNRELFDKIGKIKLNDAAAIFGTTSKESMLQGLRKSVVELGEVLAKNRPYDEIMERYEKMAGGIDAAGLTGLISESEMAAYYKLIDDLWAAIEKEK